MKSYFIPEVINIIILYYYTYNFQIKNDWDTKYFDVFQEVDPFYPKEENKKKVRKDICFLNYTYKKDVEEQKFDAILDAVEVMQALQKSTEKLNLNVNKINKFIE